jgi:membrane-bound serine protease (ClpP class)
MIQRTGVRGCNCRVDWRRVLWPADWAGFCGLCPAAAGGQVGPLRHHPAGHAGRTGPGHCQSANADGAQALLIELDTPGGLLDSTRTMAGAILGSRVPVIVYVAPAGARAGSAGFFLLESADMAAMAPGTNAGAAHPVIEFGPQPDATMNQKIENDAEAFLRSYVTRRNRNAEAAEAAVHSSHSYTAAGGAGPAPDRPDRLERLGTAARARWPRDHPHGRNKLVLHLAGARIEVLQAHAARELLGWLVNPNIALLFWWAARC